MSQASNKKAKPSTSSEGTLEMVAFFSVALIILLMLLLWPLTKQLIPLLAEAPSVHSLGSVKRSDFIGGFSIRTQVETTTKTILLYGAIEISNGSLVERRVTPISDELCLVGSSNCYEIASR